MKTAKLLITLAISALFAGIAVSCGSPESVAGATTETTNGIAIVTVSSANKPVSGANVYLSPAKAVREPGEPDRFPRTFTGSNGIFSLDSLDTIDYIIEVVDAQNNRAMGKIHYDSATKKFMLQNQDTLKLFGSGRLKGKVAKTSDQAVFVQVYGLHRIVETDKDGNFILDSLPAGAVSFKISTLTNTVAIDSTVIKSDTTEDAGEFETDEFNDSIKTAVDLEGTVKGSTGSPIANAHVFITPANELRALGSAAHKEATTTDQNGVFKLDTIDTVESIIEVVSNQNSRAMARVRYNSEEKRFTIVGGNQIELKPSGKLSGLIRKTASEVVTVQLYGMDRVLTPDTNGTFRIDSLPAGMVRFRISAGSETITDDSILVEPNKNIDMGVFQTKNYEEQLIDTTSDSSIVRGILRLNGKGTLDISNFSKSDSAGNITELYLDTLGLDTLPEELGLLNLSELSLGSNNLRSLPISIINMTNLYYIDLSGNQFTTFPESLLKIEACKTVDIETNKLSSLPSSVIDSPIEKIFLNWNFLQKLPADINTWINDHSGDDAWASKQQNVTPPGANDL